MNNMWSNEKEWKPPGYWSPTHKHLSEEVLICNSCSISIGYWNRNTRRWYVGEPATPEQIDKITHWMSLPDMPY